MKKVIRTVWISLLSGLAFLVACTTSKKATNEGTIQNDSDTLHVVTEKDSIGPRVYGPPVTESIPEMDKEQYRQTLINRLNGLNQILKRREGACVYGSPEVIESYRNETNRLREEVKQIQQKLQELDNE